MSVTGEMERETDDTKESKYCVARVNTAKSYVGSNDINLHVHQFYQFIEKKNSNKQWKKIDFLIIYCKLMTAAASNLQRISRMLRKQLNLDDSE